MKNTLLTYGIAFLLYSCTSTPSNEVLTLSGLNPTRFEKTLDNNKSTKLYTLRNSTGMEVCITNFGALASGKHQARNHRYGNLASHLITNMSSLLRFIYRVFFVAVSVAVSVAPPHAAKKPATANTNNTFFISVTCLMIN